MKKPATRRGPFSRYKGQYYIAFYDKTGEEFIEIFDNVRQILKYKNQPITRYNVQRLNIELYNSLKSEFHFTKMLDGTVMTVWLVDYDEDEKSEI